MEYNNVYSLDEFKKNKKIKDTPPEEQLLNEVGFTTCDKNVPGVIRYFKHIEKNGNDICLEITPSLKIFAAYTINQDGKMNFKPVLIGEKVIKAIQIIFDNANQIKGGNNDIVS